MKYVVSFIGLLLLAMIAHAAEPPLRIGYLADLSGPTADTDGPGAVEAARMAIEDFGGKVLDRKIELLVADHQNKPDIGMNIARRWYDVDGVDVIVDVNHSALALAVQALTRERNKIAIFTAAASAELTGKSCSPSSFHWLFDTYSQTQGIARSVVESGGDSWFFLTVDYTFGQLLEANASAAVVAAGGKVLGSARHPLNSSDFSSFLLQAQAANPKVLAFANSTSDMVNAMKQAREFNLGPLRVAFFFTIEDARALGLEAVHGLQFIDSFYWDMGEAERAWSTRYFERTKKMPTSQKAGAYSAVRHYLKAVAAAGTADTAAVLERMRALPVDDFMTHGARLREDGRLMRDMYVFEAKAPGESKGPWDLFKTVRRIPAEQAFRPASESECPLLTGRAQ
jgi:branched-chain amino acid transport system substrate-binding protein